MLASEPPPPARRSTAPQRLAKDARIAVVGAGAGGLAAAHALRHKGYRDVVVLERDARVGGKCCTFFHEGRSYELGAGVLSLGYRNVRALMREHHVRAAPKIGGTFYDLDTRRVTRFAPALAEGVHLHDAAAACARLLAAAVKHRAIARPGFDDASGELRVPFAAWARAHDLEPAARLVEPWFTAFGYGYFDDTAAAYVMKYLHLFGMPLFELLDAGYQGLWEEVARGLDVRRSTTIRRVRRGAAVTIETTRGTSTYDILVLACPLDDALGFLDASDAERDLFGRIVTNDYRVVVATVRDAPAARYAFFPAHFERAALGEPMFAYRRWPDSDLVLYYALDRPGAPMKDTVARVEETVRRLGGRVESVHSTHAWRYFPHVSCDDMERGYYEQLEAMQGDRNTFYVGELLSFGTVENVTGYSRALVDRFF